MNTRELKKILAEALQEQEDYIEFCIDCLKRLYPDDKERIASLFESFLESREDWGTVRLEDVEQRFQEMNDNIEKYKRENNNGS